MNRAWKIGDDQVGFYCPGCQGNHAVNSTWEFNGNFERPTFRPSVFVNRGRACPDLHACHSFVTDGRIQFLSDCSHRLAGQTVELPVDT